MPSPFDTEAAEQLVPDAQTEFGTSGWTYTPPTGDATSGLTVRVEESDAALEFFDVNEQSDRIAVLKVAQAELATPVADGEFSDGSDVWVLTKPPVLRAGCWHCPGEYRTRESLGVRRG